MQPDTPGSVTLLLQLEVDSLVFALDVLQGLSSFRVARLGRPQHDCLGLCGLVVLEAVVARRIGGCILRAEGTDRGAADGLQRELVHDLARDRDYAGGVGGVERKAGLLKCSR